MDAASDSADPAPGTRRVKKRFPDRAALSSKSTPAERIGEKCSSKLNSAVSELGCPDD
ncbi:hypothetical protein PHYSODRAFT_337819 [Phytophthora sojae]|uniref:Uncharacterized protein n=1 Tax=Phytophthora sojae (strain P6497) TaxID=1094619 RepID=G4ZZ36_PHYSP|nr:hypothetical protein PHYSODRAFT_337819 [Phytophthora sojae]EGZ11058.1 hypothetical protein PHYSODRAFT_337819 [Phytophthora sojae]|eukprot:XP_009533803.1 hypothetical protein PHYSODRAFT_337819 [Phytophthora sojae]